MLNKIHLIHHTHYDIGFTDQPEEVIRHQLHFLDQALRLCEGNPAYRWTIESGMLLREWMNSRSAELRERMVRQLQAGRMTVGALDMQLLTEVATFPELVESIRRTTEMGRKYGFPVDTAILDDVGGLAGEIPAAMEACGVRYLILGTGSCQTELPWADLPYLFYLRSKSGSRILVWNLGCDRNESSSESKIPYAGYSEAAIYLGYNSFAELLKEFDLGVELKLKHPETGELMDARTIYSLLSDRLERNGYPYDELLIQYGGDNRQPAPRLVELINAMNATGNYPEIVLSSPADFFRKMEELHGEEIPVLDGVLTDPWNLRFNAVPTDVKTSRAVQRLDEALRLSGIHNDELRENLLLVADHTLGIHIWGWQKIAAESEAGIRDAHFDAVRRSWRRKHLYAEQAWRLARELEHRIAEPQADTEGVAVRNITPHPVTGEAELYLGLYARKLLSLTDEKGREIPRQLTKDNTWTILAEDVPALGVKRLKCILADEYNQRLEKKQKPLPETLPCGAYTLHFTDGAITQITDADGKELLDGKYILGEPISEFIRDIPLENENCSLKPCVDRVQDRIQNWKAALTADGDLFTEIAGSARLNNGFANVTYRIWKHDARIDVRIRLDQPESPEKRACYAAFPFAGQGGTHYFDQNAGIVTLNRLLPGAMQDLFLCSRYAAMEGTDNTAVLCCPDAPMVEFGGMNTALWRKKLPYLPENNSIFPLLANNICNTDAPAWSDILEDFSFSLYLRPGKFSAPQAQQDFESATALTAALSFAETRENISGLPGEIRLHSDPNGFWMENLTDDDITYDFTFAGRTFQGKLTPFQIKLVGLV